MIVVPPILNGMRALIHPYALAWTSPSTTRANPSAERTAPAVSSLGLFSIAGCFPSFFIRKRTTTTTTTSLMNEARQVTTVAQKPQRRGPSAAPAAAADPITAYPFSLSFPGGNIPGIMANMAGIIRAEPMPSNRDQPATIIGRLTLKAVIRAPIP
jgi:hypothetical protein